MEDGATAASPDERVRVGVVRIPSFKRIEPEPYRTLETGTPTGRMRCSSS
jgi:hypothetical protein